MFFSAFLLYFCGFFLGFGCYLEPTEILGHCAADFLNLPCRDVILFPQRLDKSTASARIKGLLQDFKLINAEILKSACGIAHAFNVRNLGLCCAEPRIKFVQCSIYAFKPYAPPCGQFPLGIRGCLPELFKRAFNFKALGDHGGHLQNKGITLTNKAGDHVIPFFCCQACAPHALVNRPYFFGIGVQIILGDILSKFCKFPSEFFNLLSCLNECRSF